jgi:hypothetical protein
MDRCAQERNVDSLKERGAKPTPKLYPIFPPEAAQGPLRFVKEWVDASLLTVPAGAKVSSMTNSGLPMPLNRS